MLEENKSYPIYPGPSLLQKQSSPLSTSSQSHQLLHYSAVYCDSNVANNILESQKNSLPFRITSEDYSHKENLVFNFSSGSRGEISSISCEPVISKSEDYVLVYDTESETFTLDALGSSLFALPSVKEKKVLMHLASLLQTSSVETANHQHDKPLKENVDQAKEKEEENSQENEEVDVDIDLENGCEIDDMEIINSLDATSVAPALSPPVKPPPSPPPKETSSTSSIQNLKKRPISLTEKLASNSHGENSSSEDDEDDDEDDEDEDE